MTGPARSWLSRINHAGPPRLPGEEGTIGGVARVGAAVLIAITDRPVPGVILTVRTAQLRTHAGQVAFPGGRIDAEDGDAIAAALREAEEEIGLLPHQVEIVGITDRFSTRSGFDITPVIGIVPPDLQFTPHADEVAAIFEVPLAHVIDPANQVERTGDWQGRTTRYYEIMWQDYRIWGIAAAMIVNFGARLGKVS